MVESSMVALGYPQILALGVTGAIFTAICFIMRQRGFVTICVTVTFVLSLITTQLLMSTLSSPPYSYKYPGLVTAFHFFLVWCGCIAFWTYHRELYKCAPQSMGSLGRFCITIIPIALANPLAVLLNNNALSYAGAGVCAIVGTLSPVMVAVLARVFGRLQTPLAWVGVFIAFLGALVVARSEIQSLKSRGETTIIFGMSLALMSVLARCVKIVVMDHLMAPREYERQPLVGDREGLHPMHLYALQSPMCFATALSVAMLTEDVQAAAADLTPAMSLMIIATGLSAMVLNFTGLYALRSLGASSQQILGKLNTICVAALSMGFLGETIPLPALLGTVIILAGVMVFEKGSNLEHELDALGKKSIPYKV